MYLWKWNWAKGPPIKLNRHHHCSKCLGFEKKFRTTKILHFDAYGLRKFLYKFFVLLFKWGEPVQDANKLNNFICSTCYGRMIIIRYLVLVFRVYNGYSTQFPSYNTISNKIRKKKLIKTKNPPHINQFFTAIAR